VANRVNERTRTPSLTVAGQSVREQTVAIRFTNVPAGLTIERADVTVPFGIKVESMTPAGVDVH
jgi:hypothetical protein